MPDAVCEALHSGPDYRKLVAFVRTLAFVRKPVTHVWVQALVDALTIGGRDIEVGVARIREHYARLGYDVQVHLPWGPLSEGKRDHGYRRVCASRPVGPSKPARRAIGGL